MQQDMKYVCEQFSSGAYDEAFDFFADNLQWEITGRQTLTGKPAVVGFCEKTAEETGRTVLTNTNIIAAAGYIVIQGFCIYNRKEEKTVTFSYCDIYTYQQQKIQKITSYRVADPEQPAVH